MTSFSLNCCVYSTLPGDSQTAPRAELYCVVVMCLLLVKGAVAEVVSDSEITVRGIAARQAGGYKFDFWELLWQVVAAKQLRLTARWVKSHGGEHPEYFVQYVLSVYDFVGNGVADKLADIAAEAAEIPHA